MKHPSKNPEPIVEGFPVWTHEQAHRAVPYITSILKSVREHYLAMIAAQRLSQRLKDQPGRADREQIILQLDSARDAGVHEEKLMEAVQELTALNIHCVDPIHGLAMIPFVQGDQLAWYVFDVFEDKPIVAWRFHHEDLEKRRALTELDVEPEPSSLIV